MATKYLQITTFWILKQQALLLLDFESRDFCRVQEWMLPKITTTSSYNQLQDMMTMMPISLYSFQWSLKGENLLYLGGSDFHPNIHDLCRVLKLLLIYWSRQNLHWNCFILLLSVVLCMCVKFNGAESF